MPPSPTQRNRNMQTSEAIRDDPWNGNSLTNEAPPKIER
jgi:hypothetical protein